MPTYYQLRIIMQQPSCNWKDFGLDDIKIKLNNPVILAGIFLNYNIKIFNIKM